MNQSSMLTRRRFLGASATTIGGFMLPRTSKLIAAPSEVASTEHFWYRLAPAGHYIDSQRDNKAFGFSNERIFLSEDNGKSWRYGANFSEAQNITFSVILKNGNILFATR